MAERRMFAKTIIDSDAFLDMPQSSQLLYFHLAMRADDDGFINNPKSIMRNAKCNDDDLRLLVAKKFLIPFESGVVVIKHWRIHNYIRNDRYKETKYKEEKASLGFDENNAYTQSAKFLVDQMDTNGIPNGYQTDTNGIPMVDKMDTQYGDTQVRLGKDSIELGKDSIDNNPLIVPPKKRGEKRETERQMLKRLLPKYQISDYLSESVNDWIEYKRERNFLYKERGMKMLLSEIEKNAVKYGDEAIKDIISKSIASGYQGIVFDRLKKTGRKTDNINASRESQLAYLLNSIREDEENEGI